jgi:hypothetical protein
MKHKTESYENIHIYFYKFNCTTEIFQKYLVFSP